MPGSLLPSTASRQKYAAYGTDYGRTEKQKLHFVFMPRVCNGKQKPYYSVSSLGARWNAAVKRAG
ncbi:site-specific integrase, partial [Escherichia coli]